ncbi:Ribosomal protein L3 [Pseudomonas syringae pv. actinidiae]|uniref:Ribosomal protein L3 n=1 Tax=Pseudomonas syringae pv. actinidiae TaxID=103796 RepID=A0AAN4Q8Z6_PSESF|nr:Ribosomal protein L3 [Pseudomonas syringae pv. actinidiae]
MGFHHARHDPDALTQLRMGRLKHGVGLAHARRSTKKNLQPPTAFAGQLGQQCVSTTGITHVVTTFSDQLQRSEQAAARRILLQLRVARCRR